MAESNIKNGTFNNPYILMAILMIFWGSIAAVSKLVLNRIDNYQVVFYTFGIAVLVMSVALVFNGKIKEFREISRENLIRLILYSLPSFFYYFLYTLSLKMISAVEASMLNYLFPIMIIIFAIPINGEKLNRIKTASILLGFAGTIIILTNGRFDNIRMSNIAGDIFALGAAVSWGIFSNLGKKNKVDPFISNYIYTLVTFILSAVSVLLFSSLILPDKHTAAGLLWLGVSTIALAYYIWFKALKHASTVLIASLSFITPFVSILFIMLLLGESITLIQVAGLLVIVAGIAVQSIGKADPKLVWDRRTVPLSHRRTVPLSQGRKLSR